MVESIRELKNICYSGKTTHTPLWNRFVCMRVSIYITKLLLYTPITANQVTITMLILGIIGPALFFLGHFGWGLIILHLAVVLDNVDGEMARYRKSTGLLGMYLDTVHHMITTPLMLFGFAYGTYTLYPSELLLIFGFLSALFAQSIPVPAIFDTLISMKLRGAKAPVLDPKIKGDEVLEMEGKAKSFQSPFLRIYHLIRDLWAFPSNMLMLTALFFFEKANLSHGFLPSYLASVAFFVIYGSFVMVNQTLSFVFHTKRRSIDSFYVFLFGKK